MDKLLTRTSSSGMYYTNIKRSEAVYLWFMLRTDWRLKTAYVSSLIQKSEIPEDFTELKTQVVSPPHISLHIDDQF